MNWGISLWLKIIIRGHNAKWSDEQNQCRMNWGGDFFGRWHQHRIWEFKKVPCPYKNKNSLLLGFVGNQIFFHPNKFLKKNSDPLQNVWIREESGRQSGELGPAWSPPLMPWQDWSEASNVEGTVLFLNRNKSKYEPARLNQNPPRSCCLNSPETILFKIPP